MTLNIELKYLFLDHKFHPDTSRGHMGFEGLDPGNAFCIPWHSARKTIPHNWRDSCTFPPRLQGRQDPVWLTLE